MASQFRFLFVYGNSKKKVEIEMVGSGATKDVLMAKAQEIFEIEDLSIQTWDKGFEEWVDVEDDDLVESNTKVLVTASELKSSMVSSVSLLNDHDSSPRSDLSGPSATVSVDATCAPGPSKVAHSARSLSTAVEPASEPGPSSSVDQAGTSGPSASGAKLSSSNWHLSYVLPVLPAALEMKIRDGQQLKEPERSAILEAICSSVKVHTYYPKTGQYDFLIKLLLDKYPKLTNLEDLSCADAMSLWKYRLQYKFGNLRKREDRNIPVVKARKRKAATPTTPGPQKKKAVPQWGMTNYLPSRRASEDDASIKVHIEWMKQELRKKKPNYQRVEESMVATLADRRKMVITEGASTARTHEVYPWLFKEDEILNEFKRIEGSSSITFLLDTGFAKYAEAIVGYGSSKSNSKGFKEALSNIASQTDELAKKEALQQAAALGVPQLFDEPVEHMLCGDETATTDISVVMKKTVDEEFEVVVDGITVAEAEKFSVAFANYLAAFYCLNLEYTSTLSKTLPFFQNVILGITDNLPKGKPIVRLQARLSRFRSTQE